MVGHCHPGHGGMAVEEAGDQMLQQLLQESLGMLSEWNEVGFVEGPRVVV